jgi:histidinol phosphatase-like enzyme
MTAVRSSVFIDRDGTIIADHHSSSGAAGSACCGAHNTVLRSIAADGYPLVIQSTGFPLVKRQSRGMG